MISKMYHYKYELRLLLAQADQTQTSTKGQLKPLVLLITLI